MELYDPIDRFCFIANNRLNESIYLDFHFECIEEWIQAWSNPLHPKHIIAIHEMTNRNNGQYKKEYAPQFKNKETQIENKTEKNYYIPKHCSGFDWDISEDSRRFLVCFYQIDNFKFKNAVRNFESNDDLNPKVNNKKVRFDNSSILMQQLSKIHNSYLQ